jgi:hypothetical protein
MIGVMPTESTGMTGMTSGKAQTGRESMADLDFDVMDEGTIFILTPLTDAAQEWVDANLPSERIEFFGGIVIEHRCIDAILEGAHNDGLKVPGFDRTVH